MLSGPRLIDGRELRQSRSRALPESGSDEAELRYMVDGHPAPLERMTHSAGLA